MAPKSLKSPDRITDLSAASVGSEQRRRRAILPRDAGKGNRA
jgi:hypothetical protein